MFLVVFGPGGGRFLVASLGANQFEQGGSIVHDQLATAWPWVTTPGALLLLLMALTFAGLGVYHRRGKLEVDEAERARYRRELYSTAEAVARHRLRRGK